MSLGRAAVHRDRQMPVLAEVLPIRSTAGSDRLGVAVPRSVRQRRVAVALLTADVFALTAACVLAALIQPGLAAAESIGGSAAKTQTLASVTLVFATLWRMQSARLYSVGRLGWGSGEFNRMGRCILVGVAATVLLPFFFGLRGPSREWILTAAVLATAITTAERTLLHLIRSRLLCRGGWLQRPTLIVGSNTEAAEVARLLRIDRQSGLNPVGCLRSSLKDKLSFDYCAPIVRTLGTARDLATVVTEREIDTVIIVASAFDYDVIQRMLKDLRDLPVSVHISSALSEVLSSRVLMQEVGGLPLISLKGVSLSPSKLRAKRVFDLVIAGPIVLLGLPLWATLALLIKATSPGPIFYKQERVGRDGVPFLMYKFRSMVADAEKRLEELQCANEADGPLFKIRDDPRVTHVGRWMRKFSLDEFPQLINVLRGEMSLVGPRPPLPGETEKYSSQDWRRLEVPPGMAGLWQVSGRSELTFRDMVRLDIFYIDNWSLGFDASLLVRVVPSVLLARGAC